MSGKFNITSQAFSRPRSPKTSVRPLALGPAEGVFCLKKYNWHKRLIYLAQVPDLYILVVFAKLMIFQWPLYFLFLDNNDVKSFFKCSGNKNDPLSDSILMYGIKLTQFPLHLCISHPPTQFSVTTHNQGMPEYFQFCKRLVSKLEIETLDKVFISLNLVLKLYLQKLLNFFLEVT